MASKFDLGAIQNAMPDFGWTLPVGLTIVVGGVLVVLGVWLLLRARKPAKPAKPLAAPSPDDGPGAVRRWIDTAVQALRFLSTRREWRYQSPWLVLLGQQGAGKSTLARSLQSGRRETMLLREKQLGLAYTEWHFFSGGVLIDPDGKLPVAVGDSREAGRWQRILAGIDERRPERPLDGVVVTIAADSLLNLSPVEREQLAESCYRQLWQLQKRFEYMLPFYVVVTRCDLIRGFQALCQTQPAERQQKLWGWSTNSLQDHDTASGCVHSAFEAMHSSLRQWQIEAAASTKQIANADDFFLFPLHFAALERPLAEYLEVLLQPSTYQAGHFFRGLYFTGSAAEPEVGRERSVDFVADLFNQKVFKEINLARPVRQSIWSRNRLIRKVQIGGVICFGLLAVALGISTYLLNQQVNKLDHAFTTMQHVARTEGSDHCIDKPTVYRVFNSISGIDADMRLFAIPASWFDARVLERSGEWLSERAFREVILPSMACQLKRKAEALAATDPNKAVSSLDTTTTIDAARTRLNTYIAQTIALDKHIESFRVLAAVGSEAEEDKQVHLFEDLAEYVYGEPLPPGLHGKRGVYREALTRMHYGPPLSLPPDLKATEARHIEVMARLLRDEVLERVKLGGKLIGELNTVRDQQQTEVNDKRLDLVSDPLPERIHAFQDWLGWMRSNWLNSRESENLCTNLAADLRAALAPLDKRSDYPDSLHNVSTLFDNASCYKKARSSLLALTLPPNTLFVEEGPRLMLNPVILREVAAFPVLQKLSFMRIKPRRSFTCRTALAGWREDQLALASNYLRDYQLYADAQHLVGSQTPLLSDRIARQQLALVLDDVFNEAQQGPPSKPADSSEATMAARSSGFSRNVEALTRLVGQVRQIGYTANATNLNRCVRDFSSQMLVDLDTLAEASQLYQPATSSTLPLDAQSTLYLLGDSSQSKEYLASQRERTGVLANYGEPFVKYLDGSSAQGDSNRLYTASATYWRATQAELRRYQEFKATTGPLKQLEDFFQKTLLPLDTGNCGGLLGKSGEPANGDDLFSQRQRMLDGQSRWRCQNRLEADAYLAYRKLGNRFNRELAGRYPFAELSAPDADPNVVRAFFRDYDETRADLMARINGLNNKQHWGEIQRFLSQLDKAADFFRPTLAATGGIQPIRLDVSFRALLKLEHGGDQLIQWRLATGGSQAAHPDGERRLNWPFGEAIALDLVWAQQSIWRPRADIRQPDLQADAATASYLVLGQWSLLRLIDSHRPTAAPATDPLDASRRYLQLDVPVIGPLQGTTARNDQARVFLTLGLNTVDAKTQAMQPLLLPTPLPRAAPLQW